MGAVGGYKSAEGALGRGGAGAGAGGQAGGRGMARWLAHGDLSQAVSHCLRRSQHGRGELVHLGCVYRGSVGHLARAPARRRDTANILGNRNNCCHCYALLSNRVAFTTNNTPLSSSPD